MSRERVNKKVFMKSSGVNSKSELNVGKAAGKEKNNNKDVGGITKTFSVDSSISAISLRSLDDDDFRNLLNTAAKPQYGSLQRNEEETKKAEYGIRRLSDVGENNGLSAEADILLAQFRREAELNQRNADIETGEQQRTVTAFIKEVASTSHARKLLEKCAEQTTWDSRCTSKHFKCTNNNSDVGSNGFLGIVSNSDGRTKFAAVNGNRNVTETSNDIVTNITIKNNTSNNCIAGDISRATQTVDKPTSIAINIEDCNPIAGLKNGCANTNKIAYIDEDERAEDSCCSPDLYIGQSCDGHMNGRLRSAYTQGNTVQEIRALNDSEDDEVMVGKPQKSTKEVSTGTGNRTQKTAESSSDISVQGKHDDNSFSYSSGQLRLYGNRVGTYEMQKPRVYSMTTLGGDHGHDGESISDYYKGYVGPTFLSLIPANPSSSLLTRNLIPAQFDGRENFAKGLLEPTEDTRLNPQQVSPEIDMANQKNQPDKCAIARRRKEYKKAKEAKNVYVVESRDGYMGNLSPDEILKRIEGESKGKPKGKEKSGANVSKDQSSAVANAPKSGGGRKKSDKKERQADKGPKRSSDSEVAALSAKMETVDIDNEKAAVDESAIPEPERTSTETGNEGVKQAEEPDSAATAAARRSTNEATSATAPKAERTTPAEEGLDDEEQYMSADEGANSNASDDVYHTDEQSGASGSRDFISDGANYRADNEEVIPPPVTSEEAEFIPVTARSKKRGGGAGGGGSGMVQAQAPAQTQPTVLPSDRRSVYSSSTMERGGKTNVRRGETDRSRRGSVQLPTETPGGRGNQPTGREKNSPSPIERKVSGGKGHTGGAGTGAAVHPQQQQPQSRPATSIAAGKKTKFGAPSSLQASRTTSPDRRSTQSSTGRYAAAAAAAGSRPSDLTIYPTGSQGSFAKAILSPSHGFEKKGRGSSPGAPPPESTMGAERKVPEAQAAAAASGGGVGKPVSGTEASSSASTNVPSTRSWADIAKKRLPTDVDLRPREAFPPTSTRGLSPERRGAVKEERSISAASSTSGRAEGAKKPEHDGQQRAVSVEAVGADPAVKGYSFFFDPNEPTGTSVAKDQQSEVGDTDRGVDSEKAEDAKPSQTASGGVVLNLEGGRRIVLPEGGATTSGPTAVIDSRQCPEVQIMNDLWQEFQEGPSAPVKYKDLLRRKREEVEGKVREDRS